MVLVQKWPFFQLFFLSNLEKENVFHDNVERKNAFLRYKNKKVKKSKNWHFFERLNAWFWSKKGHFLKFLFIRNLRKENAFYDILERKNPFLRYKNKK